MNIPVPSAEALKPGNAKIPFRWRLLWAIVILAAYQVWAKFTLGYDLSASFVVTAVSAAAGFTFKAAAVMVSKRDLRRAAKEGASVLFDERALGTVTVLLMILGCAITSIRVVNDTSTKGSIRVVPMALPGTHYIPDLPSSKGASFRSLVLLPFRLISVTTSGRSCPGTTAYPIAPSVVYLSSCDPKPAVLIRIPLGAQMHLENGTLEASAGRCHIAIDTAPHIAGLWIGAEKPTVQQWHHKWKATLAAADVKGPEAEAVIGLWAASPLHRCTLGTTFTVSGSFKAQRTIPIATLEPSTLQFDEEPVDLEMLVKP